MKFRTEKCIAMKNNTETTQPYPYMQKKLDVGYSQDRMGQLVQLL